MTEKRRTEIVDFKHVLLEPGDFVRVVEPGKSVSYGHIVSTKENEGGSVTIVFDECPKPTPSMLIVGVLLLQGKPQLEGKVTK